MFLRHGRWAAILFLLLLGARDGRAQGSDPPLTRARVIELARRAPAVRVAESEIEEARGRLVGARVFARENPVLEALAGPRWSAERTTDVEVTLAVPIELGRRGRRVAVARASILRDEANLENERRVTVASALAAYYRALHAQTRKLLAEERRVLAAELLRSAGERQRAGDVARFEVNLASSELARAESEVLAEEAAVAQARAELALVLGLPALARLPVDGDLGDRPPFESPATQPAERADLRAARAEVTTAAAEVSLAEAQRLPEVTGRVTYAREEATTDILLAGLAVSLPIFERGQGEALEAQARRKRAEIELETRRAAVAVEVEAARAAYDASSRSAGALQERGLPTAIENERMARESYAAGKIDLTAMLVIRREALDTRREHADRLLDAALAEVALALATGTIP